MTKNVGAMERGVRLLVGVVLLGLAFFHVVGGASAIVAYVVGTVAVVTGLVQYCPAWSILGINTCHVAHK
jgi:uncharacterized membrane protein HdeD (DUF308 family)